MPSIIKLVDVTKRFSNRSVLDNINLEIESGEILGIVGINGSGKTTLLRALVGFYKIDSGELFFNSTPFSKVSNIKKKIGIATQDNCFYPKLTVKENVEYFGRLYGLTEDELNASLDDTLKLVNLYHLKNVLARKLSGGMQKRIGIACSIIHSPEVIILDEPTSDLDLFLRKDILNLIKLINENGITVIIASHHLSEIETLCHRIAILNGGKLLKIGTPSELKNTYSDQGNSLEEAFEKIIRNF